MSNHMVNKVLNEMIAYFGDDVKRISHSLKVHGFACAIGSSQGLTEPALQTLEIAALLHDIGIPEAERKYGSSLGKYQETEGPPVARALMERIGVPDVIVDRVCFLVGNHHTYSRIDHVDFQILVEADFLVNIVEDEMHSSAKSIGDKYFKTSSGIRMLNAFFLQ